MLSTEASHPYTTCASAFHLINPGRRLVNLLTLLPYSLHHFAPSTSFITSSAFLSIVCPCRFVLLSVYLRLCFPTRTADGKFSIDFNHLQWARQVAGDQFARVVSLVCATSYMTAVELAFHHTFFLFVSFLL